MPNHYALNRSQTGGWECNNASHFGSAPSRRDAKANCAGSEAVITTPDVEGTFSRGYTAHFSVMNLECASVTYSKEEISQAQFSLFFGMSYGKEEKWTIYNS